MNALKLQPRGGAARGAVPQIKKQRTASLRNSNRRTHICKWFFLSKPLRAAALKAAQALNPLAQLSAWGQRD